MRRRLTLALAVMATAIATMLLGPPAAQAASGTHVTECTGAIGPGTTVTTITGELDVPANATCTLDFVNVTGNVVLEPGASLVVSAYDEPSTIGGSVLAHLCGTAVLRGNVTVGKDVQIRECTGTGTSGFQGPDIAIQGSFYCAGNAGPCMAWLGSVSGDVTVQSNRTGTSDISLVAVGGDMSCTSNKMVTHSHGPSWVSGAARGQCANFSTTTTSIGSSVAPASSCAALASLAASGFPVPNTAITSAVDTPASAATATVPALPERCIINGYVNRPHQPG